MKCSVCGNPIRIIPSNSKFKDAYNKTILVLGRCCMKCALAYRQVNNEADNMTYEERASKTKERMKARGMSNKQIAEAVKKVDEQQKEIKK